MKYSELAERKQHGTADFPVEYYYVDKSHPRYIMAAHWHKEYEIIRVLSGELTVFLNSTKYVLCRGESLFVEGGCLKRAYPDNCIYECLVFDTSMLDGKLIGGAECEYKNLVAHTDRELQSCIDSLFLSVREKREFYELEVYGLLYKLFHSLYTLGYIKKASSPGTDKGARAVLSILKWIETHNTEPITLQKISEVSGLSKKYLCRIFKEYTSRTIMQYVNESRIERACSIMTHASVTEAAFASGFNDLSYFSKTFKKYKGMTPSEYKERYFNS